MFPGTFVMISVLEISCSYTVACACRDVSDCCLRFHEAAGPLASRRPLSLLTVCGLCVLQYGNVGPMAITLCQSLGQNIGMMWNKEQTAAGNAPESTHNPTAPAPCFPRARKSPLIPEFWKHAGAIFRADWLWLDPSAGW